MDKEDRIALAWGFAFFAAIVGIVVMLFNPPLDLWVWGIIAIVFLCVAVYHFWVWISDG